jgi:hypothetical protein
MQKYCCYKKAVIRRRDAPHPQGQGLAQAHAEAALKLHLVQGFLDVCRTPGMQSSCLTFITPLSGVVVVLWLMMK